MAENATWTKPAPRTYVFVSWKLDGLNHIKQPLNLGTCTNTANAWPTRSHWHTPQKQMKNAVSFSKCARIHLLFTQQDDRQFHSVTTEQSEMVKNYYLKQRERSRNSKCICT